MTHELKYQIIDKIREMISAPSCCQELKTKADEYLVAVGRTKSSENLLTKSRQTSSPLTQWLNLWLHKNSTKKPQRNSLRTQKNFRQKAKNSAIALPAPPHRKFSNSSFQNKHANKNTMPSRTSYF